jgi:VWFA-related protein
MQRFIAITLCAFALTLQAQQPQPNQPITTTETLHVSTQLVILDASVTLKKTGQTLTGLAPEDFVLQEDGAPQHIASLSQNTLPLSLVLMLDATDTVQPVLMPLAIGARRMLNSLHPGDEVAVMTFSTYGRLIGKFSTERKQTMFALNDASNVYDRSQATFIYQSLYDATDQALRSTVPNSRRVELWLTDGSANDEAFFTAAAARNEHARDAPANPKTRAEAEALLASSNVVVSALIERSSLTEQQRKLPGNSRFGDIERYAKQTGGPVEYTTSAEVVDRLGALINALRERYTLSYKPAESKPAGTICHLHLELSPAFFAQHPEVHPKDIAIRTRETYTR